MNVRNRINTQTMLPPRVSIEIGIIVSCGMIVLLYYCMAVKNWSYMKTIAIKTFWGYGWIS